MHNPSVDRPTQRNGQQHALLLPIVSKLKKEYGLKPICAFELEFYITNLDNPEAFSQQLRNACNTQKLAINHAGKETGVNQFEVALSATHDASKAVNDTYDLYTVIAQTAKQCGANALFDAKPYEDQPGCGLHAHISLQNNAGKNVFFKNDETISDELKHAIGGILIWAPHVMPIFAPKEASYKRYVAGCEAPTTFSWGANNRTTAIRLPDADHDKKHIEVRLAGADARPEPILAVILAAICYGLKHRTIPGEQIYGNASDDQYKLLKFPKTLDAAMHAFKASDIYKNDFSDAALLRAAK